MKSVTKLGLIALIAAQCSVLYPAANGSSWWPKIEISFRMPNHTKKTFVYPHLAMTTISITSSFASLAACLKGDKGKQDNLLKLGLITALPTCAVGLYFGKKEQFLNKLHLQLQEALYAVRPHAEIKALLEQIPTIHPSYHHCLGLLLSNYHNDNKYDNEIELWPLVKMMLERGVSPNVRLQNNPGVVYPTGGNTALGYALGRGYLQIAKLLLDAGANTNEEFVSTLRGFYQQGPVQYKKAKLLLDHGANIAKIYDHKTPLHIAVDWSNDDSEIIKLLFEYGAISTLNKRDNFGNTPLLSAVKDNSANCTRLLLEHGADISAQDMDGNSAYSWIGDNSDYNRVRTVLNEYHQEVHHAARHGLTEEDAKKFAYKSQKERSKVETTPGFKPGKATGDLNAIIADYIAGLETADGDQKLAAEGVSALLERQAENDETAQAQERWGDLQVQSRNFQVKATQ